MRSEHGAGRAILLGALVLSGMVLSVSLWLLFAGVENAPPADDGGEIVIPLPRPRAGGEKTTVRHRLSGGGDENEDPSTGIVEFASREPSGEIFVFDAETLRKAIGEWHRESMLYTIERMQANGDVVPAEVVQLLVDALDDPGRRQDAIAALGRLNDDRSGQTLAELASAGDLDPQVRKAALEALARSGQPAALERLQVLLADPELSDDLSRAAVRALAKVGGPEAARTLTDYLLENRDGGLSTVVIQALGGAEGSGPVIAARIRTADPELATTLLKVLQFQGSKADTEARLVAKMLAENPDAFGTDMKQSEKWRVQGAAITALATMGEVATVLRIAESQPEMAGSAYHSLRQAKGDDAALTLARAVESSTDERTQRELVEALGRTGSRKATSTLTGLLDHESANIRNAAARGLVELRDARAVDSILSSLDRPERPDYAFSQNLINALGTAGSKKALPKLEEMRASAEWKDVHMYVRRAINQIETKNPDSKRLK